MFIFVKTRSVRCSTGKWDIFQGVRDLQQYSGICKPATGTVLFKKISGIILLIGKYSTYSTYQFVKVCHVKWVR